MPVKTPRTAGGETKKTTTRKKNGPETETGTDSQADDSREVRALPDAPRQRAAILFFLNKITKKMHRISLCKHLFYADAHYFEKTGSTLTEFPYLHIEGSPQPVFFNEMIHQMVIQEQIEVIPNVVTQKSENGPITVLKGLSYNALQPAPNIFDKEEKKVLNSVASLLGGDLSLETRYYSALYQRYAQTGLYEVIDFSEIQTGKRPHLSWKAWASKIFKLIDE